MGSTVTTICDISLRGHFYNHWPLLKILFNDRLMFDGQVENDLSISLSLQCGTENLLKFVHHGKQFGENGIFDSNHDGTESCSLEIIDIRFDGVSIDHLKNQLWFESVWTDEQRAVLSDDFVKQYSKIQSNGSMNFNGHIILDFSVPVYNWLIMSKYKVPMVDLAYFSNYSSRWHYERDLELISQIKTMIDDQDSSS